MILLSLVIIAFGYLYISNIVESGSAQFGSNPAWYRSRVTTIRLEPGEDLKNTLLEFIKQYKCSAASIVTAVGSLSEVNIRLASASADGPNDYFVDVSNNYEIVSLVGTMEYTQETDTSYGHLHVSLADKEGKVVGGHLMSGCTVLTTAEVTLMQIPRLQYSRVLDTRSGYKELMVSEADGYFFQKLVRTYEKGMVLLWNHVSVNICPYLVGTDTCKARY